MIRFNPITALEASFRGFPFKVSRYSRPGGQRGQHHEYPDRDIPYFEPLGRKAHVYDLDVYFVALAGDSTGGTTADIQADAFVALLDQGKSGALMLPGLDRQQVYARNWTPVKEAGKAGWITLTVQFVEAGKNQYPTSSTSWPSTLLASAQAAMAAVTTALGNVLSVAGLPLAVAGDVVSVAFALSSALNSAAQLSGGGFPSTALAAATGLTTGYTAGLPGQKSQSAGPALDSEAFAASTGALISAWADALVGADVAGTPPTSSALSASIAALFNVYGVAGQVQWYLPGGLSTVQAIEIANRTAFAAAVRRMALIQAARLAASLSFASYDDAAALRQQFALAFDLEIDLAGTAGLTGNAGATDGVRPALGDLQTTTLLAISDAGASKARLVPYITRLPRTALGLAQLFYPEDGDVPGRAAELAARNGALHPAFMPVQGERLSS